MVTIHSIYCLTSSAHKPGNPFTLQEYFGFHICKRLHANAAKAYERAEKPRVRMHPSPAKAYE